VGEAEKRIFPYPIITLARAWKTLRDQTGIKDVRIHDLRVAFGSYGASAGVPLKTLASMMGHSTLRMLEKHYVGVSESDSVLASNTIQKSFETTLIAGDKSHEKQN
jgi:integrase